MRLHIVAAPNAMDDASGDSHLLGKSPYAPVGAAVPGRVFKVTSRIRCSNAGVNTLAERLRLRTALTAVRPLLAKALRIASTVGRDTFNCRAMAAFATPW